MTEYKTAERTDRIINAIKPLRIPVKGIKPPSNKELMSAEQTKFLISGEVLIEEKIDGKPIIFEKKGYIILAEDISIRHSIKYRAPGKFFIFDIIYKDQLLTRDNRLEIIENIRNNKMQIDMKHDPHLFLPIPKIAEGKFTIEQLPGLICKSGYSVTSEMEGIVVKQDRPLFIIEASYSRGKIVQQEFSEQIKENYMERRTQDKNIIDFSMPVIYTYINQ